MFVEDSLVSLGPIYNSMKLISRTQVAACYKASSHSLGPPPRLISSVSSSTHSDSVVSCLWASKPTGGGAISLIQGF